MTLKLSDLPPRYQQQIIEQYTKQGKALPPDLFSPTKPEVQIKYHNKLTEREAEKNSIIFHSKKEARRYDELMLLLKAGAIRKLKLQPQFTLQESFITPDGERVQAIRYTADFSYEQREESQTSEVWTMVVEDVKVKATQTATYKAKKKMMIEKLGIKIQEV